jgi:hypothetical protein
MSDPTLRPPWTPAVIAALAAITGKHTTHAHTIADALDAAADLLAATQYELRKATRTIARLRGDEDGER